MVSGYHSIIFNGVNTWDEWNLVPTSRPVFAPPALKEHIIDIPGRDGNIDLSEALTKYPVYKNREGSFEFIVVNDTYVQATKHEQWYKTYSKIMEFLHGQKMTAVLEDDLNYQYEGRFYVNNWKSEEKYSKIVIDYSVNPYKWDIFSVMDNWLWDPFNFETGVVSTFFFKDLNLTGAETTVTYKPEYYGKAPVSPKFHIATSTKSGIIIHFINSYLGIDVTQQLIDGEHISPDIVFYGPLGVTLTMKAVKVDSNATDDSVTGKVSIDFRKGKL